MNKPGENTVFKLVYLLKLWLQGRNGDTEIEHRLWTQWGKEKVG